ncbi:unnamed protein product, partial [Allacma fusca]
KGGNANAKTLEQSLIGLSNHWIRILHMELLNQPRPMAISILINILWITKNVLEN